MHFFCVVDVLGWLYLCTVRLLMACISSKCYHFFYPLALANLRSALLSLASGNSVQGASGGGLPGSVLLVSNLNEKVYPYGSVLKGKSPLFFPTLQWQYFYLMSTFSCAQRVRSVLVHHQAGNEIVHQAERGRGGLCCVLLLLHANSVPFFSFLSLSLSVSSWWPPPLFKMITPHVLFILFGMSLFTASVSVCALCNLEGVACIRRQLVIWCILCLGLWLTITDAPKYMSLFMCM